MPRACRRSHASRTWSCEINPLALAPDGRLIACDPKVIRDDSAAFRHDSDEFPLSRSLAERAMTPLERSARERCARRHLERKRRREPHPVEDFLFTYYPTRPNQLRIWHPGPGIRLLEASEYDGRRGYTYVDGAATLDPAEVSRRADSIRWIRRLLAATLDRQPQFGCFGLHEWAMVYRTSAVRHEKWPLRLGTAGTDQVVESHKIACSHFDAFRFFTSPARPLNVLAADP